MYEFYADGSFLSVKIRYYEVINLEAIIFEGVVSGICFNPNQISFEWSQKKFSTNSEMIIGKLYNFEYKIFIKLIN